MISPRSQNRKSIYKTS